MMRKILSVLCIAMILLGSCGGNKNDNAQLEKEVEALMQEKQGNDLLAGLMELDKKYKDNLSLKINIAGILLLNDNMKDADEYLKQGLALVKKSKSGEEKYLFYTNYAVFEFKNQNYDKCIEYAKNALDADKSDPLGVKITMAKGYAELQDNASAIKLMKDAWNNERDKFIEEDMVYLLMLLGSEVDSLENIEIVVSIADELSIRKPSMTGTGLQQAQVLEDAGYMIGALTASFSELDRMRFLGRLTDDEIYSTLNQFASHFPADSPYVRLLDGFRLYMHEDWDKADDVFSSMTPEVPLNFYTYLQLVSRANSSRTSVQACDMLQAAGDRFPLFQGYYYYFWKALDKNGLLDKEKGDPVLRECILSNPSSRFGIDSKKRLGALYGIADGENILLRDELMVYYVKVKGGESTDMLEPVARFLNMGDNQFRTEGARIISELEKLPGVKEWLSQHQDIK